MEFNDRDRGCIPPNNVANIAIDGRLLRVGGGMIQRERRNDVEAPRYKNRKQREQAVIKTPAREQPNDVATHLLGLLTDGNSLE